MIGTVYDNYLGTFDAVTSLTASSPTTLTDAEGTTGSFNYVKQNATEGHVTYLTSYWEPGYAYSESGTIAMTFTSPSTGFYSTTSNYTVYIAGTYINSMFLEYGTFDYDSPPLISDVANLSTPAGVKVTAPFTVSDPAVPADWLTVTASSSNATLVPASSISFGGSGGNRTISITPPYGSSGTATITITVNDGSRTTSDSFVLTVTPGNKPPTISGIALQMTNEDTPTGLIPFTISDTETAATALTVTCTASTDPILIPIGNVLLAGTGASRTVKITPVPNQSGASIITLQVSDGTHTATITFLVVVDSVNDAPTLSDIANVTIAQSTSTPAIPFTIGDIDHELIFLSVRASSSNPTLVPPEKIVIAGTGANRTIIITPAPGISGQASITVSVTDGPATTSKSFLVDVLSIRSIEGWRLTHFSNTGNTGDGANLNDYDRDGMSNLMEFALGTLPKDRSSFARPVAARELFNGTPHLTLTVTRPADLTGILYEIQVSDNLVDWSQGTAHTTFITSPATTLKVRDNTPATAAKRFIRLAVRTP